MGRPKKQKRDSKSDGRISTDQGFLGEEGFHALLRQEEIDRLRVDPMSENPLAPYLTRVIFERSDAHEERDAGALFVRVLQEPNLETVERFFRLVLQLKRNAQSPHRNAYAYYAYAMYFAETGKEPSKPELKEYMQVRRNHFPDIPGDNDGKGWYRLWRASGLTKLENG